jgi:molybdate/tungstate transport system substrate-binding protein
MRATFSGLCLALAFALLAPRAHAADKSVKVLYAGSLVNLMEHDLGPAFEKETGLGFSGFAAGSNQLANEIKGKLKAADVFISASPKADASLMGAANGDLVRWYATFGASPLLIAYNPNSRFAEDLRRKRWDKVLQEPGIRIGRTDAKLDPKGALTLDLIHRAAAAYNEPGLLARTLGAADNPEQVFPEEALIGRLESGQLDVGFFYSTETVTMKLPEVRLPADITPRASYTIAILGNADNPAGAGRFVAFLLGPHGRALLEKNGLELTKPTVTGDVAEAPPAVRSIVAAQK